jgi:hypothetical protein
VLKVVAKTRTGRMNFTEATQKALQAEHGERTVSLGGSFVIKKGKAKLHVMPDFSKTPLKARVVCVPLGLPSSRTDTSISFVNMGGSFLHLLRGERYYATKA